MLRRVPPQPVVVLALCAAYGLYCLATMPPGPVTAPDSPGYLALWPIHTLGYPLFLKVLGAKGATIAQPILFALALAWLGIETRRLTSSEWPAVAVVLASMIVPDLATYHASILTESLFMSGLIGVLAAMVRFARAPSWDTAAAASLIAGLTATVRRTGLAFLPVLAIMALLQRRKAAGRWKTLAAAIVPMLAVITGERLAARAVHGAGLTSIMGRHLYAKASLIDAAPPAQRSPDAVRGQLEDHLGVAYAPLRDLLDRAPRDVRSVLTLYYETCLQGPCVPELGESTSGTEGRAMNDALMQVGLERISRAPVPFASLTMRHYYSLWAAYKQRHPQTAGALNSFIASNRPLPFERAAFKVNPEDPLEFRPSAAVRFVQPMAQLAGLITGSLALLGLVAAVSGRSLSPATIAACLASLAAHAGLMFTALFAAGLSRFIVELWPAITTAMVFAAWSLYPGGSSPSHLRSSDHWRASVGRLRE